MFHYNKGIALDEIERTLIMKKLAIVLMLFSLLLLASCSNDSDTEDSNHEDMEMDAQPIEATLDLPEKAEVMETIEAKVTVLHNGEAVEDADEVEFEYWLEGKKGDSEMIMAEHIGEGVYKVEVSFDATGTYILQSHVTALAQHTMPKQEIEVTD